MAGAAILSGWFALLCAMTPRALAIETGMEMELTFRDLFHTLGLSSALTVMGGCNLFVGPGVG